MTDRQLNKSLKVYTRRKTFYFIRFIILWICTWRDSWSHYEVNPDDDPGQMLLCVIKTGLGSAGGLPYWAPQAPCVHWFVKWFFANLFGNMHKKTTFLLPVLLSFYGALHIPFNKLTQRSHILYRLGPLRGLIQPCVWSSEIHSGVTLMFNN